jgi:hypothetical protein
VHHPRSEEVKSAFIKCACVSDWLAVMDEFYAADASFASSVLLVANTDGA